MTTIYLLRKHPPHPYNNGGSHLQAFTIVGVYTNRAACFKVAKDKNKRSKFLFTVKALKVPSNG